MKLKAFFNLFKGFSVFRICICARGKFFFSHYAAQRLGPKSRLVSKIQLSLSVWFELGTFRFWVTHHDTVLHYPNRHVTFPVFPGILVFWILFARKWILVKTRRKLVGRGEGKGMGVENGEKDNRIKQERNLYFINYSCDNCRKHIMYICFIKWRRSWRRDYLFCIDRATER